MRIYFLIIFIASCSSESTTVEDPVLECSSKQSCEDCLNAGCGAGSRTSCYILSTCKSLQDGACYHKDMYADRQDELKDRTVEDICEMIPETIGDGS